MSEEKELMLKGKQQQKERRTCGNKKIILENQV